MTGASPDPPLLTPEAAAQLSEALADLVVNDPGDVEFVPMLGTIGSPQAVGKHLGRAFLAVHDPEALAERFAREEKLDLLDQVIVKRAYGWLGLGGDDA
jgi:hypothetical protein